MHGTRTNPQIAVLSILQLTGRPWTIEAHGMSDARSSTRLSPLWLGFVVSGSLLLVLIVVETVFGRWAALTTTGEFDALARGSTGVLRDLRIAIVHSLVAGYVSAALLFVVRNGRRTVKVLQQALNFTPEECARLAASVRLSRRWLVIIAVVGLALALISPYLVPPVPKNPWDPSSWQPEVYWHRLLGPVVVVMQLWLGYAIVSVSLRMSRIARKLSDIDLLDLSPLGPFTQLGLTNALLLFGLLSIWSLMMIETGFGRMMVIIGGITLVFATLALFAPVQGVHARIRQSKTRELDWVNGEIAARRATLQDATPARAGGELADLVAYRSLIDGVPEWPFTTSTYARLVLYALIPLMSWGIGVVAEEIVGRALF